MEFDRHPTLYSTDIADDVTADAGGHVAADIAGDMNAKRGEVPGALARIVSGGGGVVTPVPESP
jgi:hypothetical protein